MKTLIESKLSPKHLLVILLQESVFKRNMEVSDREFWEMIKHLEENVPQFIWDESAQPGMVWGFLKGTRQPLFRYDQNAERLHSSFTYQELRSMTQKGLRKFLVTV